MMGREEVGGGAEARSMSGGKRKAYCGWEAVAEKMCWGGRVTLGEGMGGFFCFILFSSC